MPTFAAEATSSAMATSGLAPVSVGASLARLTRMLTGCAAVLNAELPPLRLASARAPAVPVVRSQARIVSPAGSRPSHCGSVGVNRISASCGSSRAEASLTPDRLVQVVVPASWNAQVPRVVSTPTTATPTGSPSGSESVKPAMSSETGVMLRAGLGASQSRMDPAPRSTGASFTAATWIDST